VIDERSKQILAVNFLVIAQEHTINSLLFVDLQINGGVKGKRELKVNVFNDIFGK